MLKLLPTVTLFGNPIVIVSPETDVSISFAVPAIVIVSPPSIDVLPLSPANVKDVEILAVLAAVIRPFASTVNTGIAVELP